jgi:pilus assembly protein Flp/PilA
MCGSDRASSNPAPACSRRRQEQQAARIDGASVNLNSKGHTMNAFLKALSQSVRSFARDDDGAQVVEYALIIAVVSIILVVALRNLTGTSFTGFIGRVATCLTSSATCA